MDVIILTGGFTKVTLPIPDFHHIWEIKQEDEVIMGIHTVLFMRMEWSWLIIKIPIIGGIILVNYLLEDGNLSETSNCQVAEFLIFQGLKPDDDRYLIEGYLGHKWGIDLPSNHPWATEKPTFGEEVISGSTAVSITTSTLQPIVRNRDPANLKKNSAMLTGQLVDSGLARVPTDPANAQFSPQHYPGLRLWLDVSDANGDGIPGSDYDDANVTPPGSWNPVLSPALWLDASELTTADTNWADKGPNGNDATKHGSPTVVSNAHNGLSVMRYSGSSGTYHSFPEFTNIRTVFWVYKDMGAVTLCSVIIISITFIKVRLICSRVWTSPNVLSGLLKVNGSIVPTSGEPYPSSLSLLSLRTTGNGGVEFFQ